MSNTDNNFEGWNSANYKKVPRFSLERLKVDCLCVKVYDGDTITVIGRTPELFNNELRIYKVRILGLDTPEIRGYKSQKEKVFAKVVRDHLKEMILNKTVQIDFSHFGKYGGRTLADVFYNGLNISDYLINKKYAFAYDGGTKQMWFPEEIEREKKDESDSD
jgi:endonuclease YncB( thermonuclease family)